MATDLATILGLNDTRSLALAHLSKLVADANFNAGTNPDLRMALNIAHGTFRGAKDAYILAGVVTEQELEELGLTL